MGCLHSTQRTSRSTAHLDPPSHQREPSPGAWQQPQLRISTPLEYPSDPNVSTRAQAAPLEGLPLVQFDGTLSLQTVLDETSGLMREIEQSKETLGHRVAPLTQGVTNLKKAIENLMAEGRATSIDYAAVLAHFRQKFALLTTATHFTQSEETTRHHEVTTQARSSDAPFAMQTLDR